jgi:hypothetical protein
MQQDSAQLRLFQADTLASLFLWPGSEKARQMTATSGLRCLMLSKMSDPLGSLEKMLLGTLHWGSIKRYLTWQVRATPQGRLLFRLVPKAPSTEETEFSLSPTITAADSWTYRLKTSKARPGSHSALSLHQAVAWNMFPTPMAADATAGAIIGKGDTYEMSETGVPRKITQSGASGSLGLARYVKLIPTPVASEYKRMRAYPGDASRHSLTIADIAATLEMDCTGFLNPSWVEWLMGFPLEWTKTG